MYNHIKSNTVSYRSGSGFPPSFLHALGKPHYFASSHPKSLPTLPLHHHNHQQQKVPNRGNPCSRAYGIKSGMRHSTTGRALYSLPKRSASRRASRGRSSKVRPSPAASRDGYVGSHRTSPSAHSECAASTDLL